MMARSLGGVALALRGQRLLFGLLLGGTGGLRLGLGTLGAVGGGGDVVGQPGHLGGLPGGLGPLGVAFVLGLGELGAYLLQLGGQFGDPAGSPGRFLLGGVLGAAGGVPFGLDLGHLAGEGVGPAGGGVELGFQLSDAGGGFLRGA
jgi:hypothetical protein